MNINHFLQHAASQAQAYLSRLPSLERTPLVSVIIPTYNRPFLLKDALYSLIRQTYTDWEAIVVNDGGEALKAGAGGIPEDPRIRIINLTDHRERSACRNLALDVAKGEYIAFLDDDDLFYPHHLEVLVRTLENDPAGRTIAYSDSHRSWGILEDNRFRIQEIENAFGQPFDPDRLLVTNNIPIMALIFHREVLRNERFDETLNLFEDHDLLIRLSRRDEFHHIPVVTHQIRSIKLPDSDHLKRRLAQFRMLYDRYAEQTVDRWDIRWQQVDFLRSMENLDFRITAPYLPSVTVILRITEGIEQTTQILQSLFSNTDYERYDVLLIIGDEHSALQRTLSSFNLRCRVLPLPSDFTSAEAYSEAVQITNSDLLLFLEESCLPAKSYWLGELVETHEKGADPVCGMLINVANGISIAHAGIASDTKNHRVIGLYEGFPFYLPLLTRVRSVGAAFPGAILISRRLFLQAGGLDDSLSGTAQWINISIHANRTNHTTTAFDPFAALLANDAICNAHREVSSADLITLKKHWGEDFLPEAEKCYTEDGFGGMVGGGVSEVGSFDGSFTQLMKWADYLIGQGRREEARAVLEPAGRIFPENEEIFKRLRIIASTTLPTEGALIT